MDKHRHLVTKNGLILKDIEANIEEARKGIHHIEHKVKGKQITRKWLTVFLLFGVWTVFQLVLVQYKNDYLIVITAFSIIFAAVYYIYKPIIENFKKNGYRKLVLELTPSYEEIVKALHTQSIEIGKENLDFESIYLVNDIRIDLNQDFTDLDLAQKQVYVYIVKALEVDADIANAAAKFTIHILTKTPFHEL